MRLKSQPGMVLCSASGPASTLARTSKNLLSFTESLSARNTGTAFLFSSSGTGNRLPRLIGLDYHRRLRRILQDKGYTVVGEFSCKGFDTYGTWGKLGGIAKGHPTDSDLQNACAFVRSLVQLQ